MQNGEAQKKKINKLVIDADNCVEKAINKLEEANKIMEHPVKGYNYSWYIEHLGELIKNLRKYKFII